MKSKQVINKDKSRFDGTTSFSSKKTFFANRKSITLHNSSWNIFDSNGTTSTKSKYGNSEEISQ